MDGPSEHLRPPSDRIPASLCAPKAQGPRRDLPRRIECRRLLGEHPPFRDFISELYGILQDERDDTMARVSAALFSGAIAGTVINPLLDDIDDATLCAVLIQLTTRMLELPD